MRREQNGSCVPVYRYELEGEIFLPDLALGSSAQGVQLPQAGSTVQTRASSGKESARAGNAGPTGPLEPNNLAANGIGTPEAKGHSSNDREKGGADEGDEVGNEDEGILKSSSRGLASSRRWRLHISVPYAAVQDLLPAAQLLSSVNKPNVDYGAAKAAFLAALQHAIDSAAGIISPGGQNSAAPAILADDLRRQVCKVSLAGLHVNQYIAWLNQSCLLNTPRTWHVLCDAGGRHV